MAKEKIIDIDVTDENLVGETTVYPSLVPADPAGLLDDVTVFLQRFIAYPSPEALIAHLLWICHTHLMQCWESTARLLFLSPEPGSGKSRALEVSELLVAHAVMCLNVSPSFLFRRIDMDPEKPPTLLFDEADATFGYKANGDEDLRALLNAGHRRDATVGRIETVGNMHTPTTYSAYCAVAMAGLGDLPETIMQRAVVIRMRRRAPSENVEPYRRRLVMPEGVELHDKLAAWARSVEDALKNTWPEMPEGLEDRPADVWEALIAVADAAGGHWPETARKTALKMVDEATTEPISLGVRLLGDLRLVFNGQCSMWTKAILTALNEMPEAPWGNLKGHPMDDRGLANRLKPYGIKSRDVRDGGTVRKGYTAEDLHDAWERYLPPLPQKSATSATDATKPANVPSTGVAVANVAHVADFQQGEREADDEAEVDRLEREALQDERFH